MPETAAGDGPALMRELAASYTQSTGQLCTKPGLVLVPADSHLAEVLAQEITTIAASRMLTPGLHDRFTQQIHDLRGAGGLRVVAELPGQGSDAAAPIAFAGRAADLPDAALDEVFGPATILVHYDSIDEVLSVLRRLGGSLTGAVHSTPTDDEASVRRVLTALAAIAGRVIHNGWPTGVAVVPAMNHGGPWPSATTSLHTSVGLRAARRFMRPVCYQNVPDSLLPPALQDANPLGIQRTVDGTLTREPLVRPAGSIGG
jgi:NADP-dependent aldehyde dehydrogenase